MNDYRKQSALEVREKAARMAFDRPHPRHESNTDEHRFRHALDSGHAGEPSLIASFTKGLPHDPNTGLVAEPSYFQWLVKGIDSGDPRDFRDTPLAVEEHCYGMEDWCPKIQWHSQKSRDNDVSARAWESTGAGRTYDLEGPDAQAVTMPPAPDFGSDELTAEVGEVYVQALLRDVPFTAMAAGTAADVSDVSAVEGYVDELNKLSWFNTAAEQLTGAERARSRGLQHAHTVFRGRTPGDLVGPYISQFLLAGNSSINGVDVEPGRASGLIAYGGQNIDQRVRVAKQCKDYMTDWPAWLDVQNGADLRGLEDYDNNIARRFITTPRDLATFVHYDALYQAYLNACLLMLGAGLPFDPGIPYQRPDNIDHQQGFAHFGGPHILSLVTEVATRALKAVRYQKFNVHRRARPEVMAARIERFDQPGVDLPAVADMKNALEATSILDDIRAHNFDQNNPATHGEGREAGETSLLPMAFCEGSPMHPSYGAGHATVAGACVTILKAFFDHGRELDFAETGNPARAFVANADGSGLDVIDVLAPSAADASVTESGVLTVEGELNKLCSNISIGRNWAGVHYYTDYIESIRMGEQVALGVLEEQKLTYGENFSMTVPLFDGATVRI